MRDDYIVIIKTAGMGPTEMQSPHWQPLSDTGVPVYITFPFAAQEGHMFDTTGYAEVPAWVLEELIAYGKTGRPVGSFCEAVLANDLKDAVARGNCDLRPIVRFVYNELPGGCWGNREKVAEWIARGGLEATTLYGSLKKAAEGEPVYGYGEEGDD